MKEKENQNHFYDLKVIEVRKIPLSETILPKNLIINPDQLVEKHIATPTKVDKRLLEDTKIFNSETSLFSLFADSLADVKKFCIEMK